MKRAVLAVGSLLASFVASSLADQECTYYIGPQGSNANNCTSDFPCNDFNTAESVLLGDAEKNCTDVQFYFHSGTYRTEDASIPKGLGYKSFRIKGIGTTTEAKLYANNTSIFTFDEPDFEIIFESLNLHGGSTAKGGGLVYINSPKAEVKIIGCTLENGFATNNGGALYIDTYHSVVIQNSLFSSNTANGTGGAIFCPNEASILNISDSTLNGNWAMQGAGAVYAGGYFYINGTQFLNNQAHSGNGGGLILQKPSYGSTIINSDIEANIAVNGGGVFVKEGKEVFLYNTKIKRNQATLNGGGVFFMLANAHLYNASIYNNSANANGGGVFMDGPFNASSKQTIFVQLSSIRDNYAGQYAGGVYCNGTISNWNGTEIKYNMDNASTSGGEGDLLDNVYCDSFCETSGFCSRCECHGCSDCPHGSGCAVSLQDDVCTCFLDEKEHEKCAHPLTSSEFPSSPLPSGNSGNAGTIVGIIFAVLIAIAVATAIAWYIVRRRSSHGEYTRLMDNPTTVNNEHL